MSALARTLWSSIATAIASVMFCSWVSVLRQIYYGADSFDDTSIITVLVIGGMVGGVIGLCWGDVQLPSQWRRYLFGACYGAAFGAAVTLIYASQFYPPQSEKTKAEIGIFLFPMGVVTGMVIEYCIRLWYRSTRRMPGCPSRKRFVPPENDFQGASDESDEGVNEQNDGR